MHETEVKIAVDDAAGVVARLEATGAELLHPREFEDNRLYDHDDLALTRAGRLLRVRRSGDRTLVTAKAPAEAGASA
ncbi:MAG: CYTH domain-containing protein, partial [Gemmatimonadetes bacterium]|nr:CYTH domain-containing protein [Gemmatimonadota bacterium]